MFEHAFQSIESVVTPLLQKSLDKVRQHKENKMAETQKVASTWKCAVCDASGMKAPRYVKTHMSAKHSDIPKEDQPAPIEVLPMAATEEGVAEEAPTQETLESAEPVTSLEALAAKKVDTPEATLPPVNPPPMAAPPTPLPAPTEVTIGSVIELQGPQWKMDPITNQWVGFTTNDIRVDVLERTPGADGAVMLSCRTVTGTDLWSVPESSVLNGTLLLISDVTVVPEDIPDPAELAEREALTQEFKERAGVYVKARDAFSAKEKSFTAVKESHREFLVEFIKKYGVQDKDSHSTLLEDLGFYSQVVVSKGSVKTTYNEGVIVQFLMANGLDNYLSKPGFEVEKWDLLKTLKAQPGGALVVGTEFVKSVEQHETPEPRESLCINVLK